MPFRQPAFKYTDSLQNFRINRHPFGLVTDVPVNVLQVSVLPFKKANLKRTATITAATLLCMTFDQTIVDGTGKLLRSMGIEQESKFSRFISIGDIRIFSWPRNINSFFYQLGQPGPVLLLAGGMYLAGKISKKDRPVRTAGELVESYLTSELLVQGMKRICGRQSPNKATVNGGKWQWFPSWRDYQSDMTNYGSFPSGHMATMIAAVTTLALNYPEKKWIKPVGYALTALTALSQQNNKTHWASDYIMGLAMGYATAKLIHRRRH